MDPETKTLSDLLGFRTEDEIMPNEPLNLANSNAFGMEKPERDYLPLWIWGAIIVFLFFAWEFWRG